MSTPLRPAPLPERGKEYLRMVWPRAGQSVRAYCFSPFVVGRYMHWVDGHSELCVIETGHCPWHQAGIPTRWYGYLYGHYIERNCPCLLQLTAECVRSSLQLSDPSFDLRGSCITLTRRGGRHNAPVTAHIQPQACRLERPDFVPDVLAHLARFYRVSFSLDGRHSMDEGGEA